MKTLKLIISVCILSFLEPGLNGAMMASERKVNFNEDWKFRRGSIANAEQPSFNDAKWRTLDLPHDWSIEPVPVQKEGITTGPFSKLNESGADGADTGQTLGGEGWYRKTFTLTPEDKNKVLTLYFEGAYNQAEVWINGEKVSFNAYGYIPFRVNLSDHCYGVGEPNVIAVKVVNAGQNSRWYSGSGIYRPVWLIKTEKAYLDEWATFVDASELEGKDAILNLRSVITNKQNKDIDGNISVQIYAPSGNEVYTSTEAVKIQAFRQKEVALSFKVKNPLRWTIDKPQLYKAKIALSSGTNKFDEITVPFGIRTISFNAQEGFLLNGKPLKLKGGCLHNDNGLLGAMAINRAEERKVELMKANGFNAVRCSHNLPSEYFLDACDRLGLLVINEVFDQWQEPKRPNDYHQYFDEWSENDMSIMVCRDRNHPSVIMWSIGNEIAQRADPEGENIAKRLINIIHKYDKTRFTTAGVNDFWDRSHKGYTWDKDSERAFRNIDIAGYNYMRQKKEPDHDKFPNRIMYGSESYPKDAATNWNLVEKHPYIIGDFVWTAIDYLGEAGLGHALELEEGEQDPQFMGWPWYNAWCGDIDLCGDKKPQSYYRDIVWRQREISMAVHPPVTPGKKEVVNAWGWPNELQSWSWKGIEGQTMQVNIYSRSPRVRLYLNDKVIGEKEVSKDNYTATFEVAYQPGVLKGVNIVKNKESAAVELKTAGEATSIRLTPDRSSITADKNDLAYVKIELVDKDGNVVPDTRQVNIACSGNGNVIASGNASYNDMKSFRSLTPNTFRGKAIAIIQPNKEKGFITLKVSSSGLPASISIKTE